LGHAQKYGGVKAVNGIWNLPLLLVGEIRRICCFAYFAINKHQRTPKAIKNGQSREAGNIGTQDTRHKTKTNKTKSQHDMCSTPPHASKRKQVTRPSTNNRR
jgi:hypothetical protein